MRELKPDTEQTLWPLSTFHHKRMASDPPHRTCSALYQTSFRMESSICSALSSLSRSCTFSWRFSLPLGVYGIKSPSERKKTTGSSLKQMKITSCSHIFRNKQQLTRSLFEGLFLEHMVVKVVKTSELRQMKITILQDIHLIVTSHDTLLKIKVLYWH